MKIQNINVRTNFNSKFLIKKSLSEIVVDNKPRTVQTITIEKRGLAYLAGIVKNFYNFIARKASADNRLVHEKVKILEARGVNKQGLIYIIPQEVSGEFLTKNKEYVQYFSPTPGTTYVRITKPDKTVMNVDINGGMQGTNHSEARRLITQKSQTLSQNRKVESVFIKHNDK